MLVSVTESWHTSNITLFFKKCCLQHLLFKLFEVFKTAKAETAEMKTAEKIEIKNWIKVMHAYKNHHFNFWLYILEYLPLFALYQSYAEKLYKHNNKDINC